MKIVINDANILIDLIKLDLLDAFTKLNFNLHTTDFIIEELYDEQKETILGLNKENKIKVIETHEAADFQGIISVLNDCSGLSFEDCSVYYYSKKMSGILLTGDGKLREYAKKDDIEVHGIIYLFDMLLNQNLINHHEATEKIEQLQLLNNRLPDNEISKRIKLWNKNQ